MADNETVEAQEDGSGIRIPPALIVGLITVAFLPLAILIGGAGYLYSTKKRVRPRVLTETALLVALITLAAAGWLITATIQVPNSLPVMVDVIRGEKNVSAIFGHMLVTLPVAAIFGLLAAALFSWLFFRSVPQWERKEFKLTPYEWWKKKKIIDDIKNDKVTPRNGATLGVNSQGQRVVQTDQESSAHTLILGASGTGKTTTMMMKIRDLMKRGHSVIIVDLKGGDDFPDRVAEYANRYGRGFQHFLFQDPTEEYTGPSPLGPAYYDPLSRGTASRRKDMVISVRQRWSEEYYRTLASDYVQTAFDVMLASPPSDEIDSIGDIMRLLNPENLARRARALPVGEYYSELRDQVERWTNRNLTPQERSAIEGIHGELAVLRNSIAGKWLRYTPDREKIIDLHSSAVAGDAIVFSLDSLTYSKIAPLVANLIIEDLKTLTGELSKVPAPNPTHVFIDEFSAIDSNSITGLISKSRSSQLTITLATQALGDLRSVNQAFLSQLLGIVGAFIFHRANTLDDSEEMAGLIGKQDQWKRSMGIEQKRGIFGTGQETGVGSVSETTDYRISPSVIQQLTPGEMYFLATNPKRRIEHVRVIPEAPEMTGNTRAFTPTIPQPRPTEPTTLSPKPSPPQPETLTPPHTSKDTGERIDLNKIAQSLTPPKPTQPLPAPTKTVPPRRTPPVTTPTALPPLPLPQPRRRQPDTPQPAPSKEDWRKDRW